MITALLILLAAAPAVLAEVTVDNPLGGQLPLIPRVGKNYAWSFSPLTFSTNLDYSLSYTASGLPSWCSFDNATQTLHGVPSAKDEGPLQITVSASDSESSAMSSFSLLVTADPPPTLQVPLQTQFFQGSPSLSSTFFLSPGSALKTDNFSLRVPSRWSFSVSILRDTFLAENNVYYAALQADGTPLPDWVTFDTDTVTFRGVAPSKAALPTPYTLSIDVHASDQPGYSAGAVSFDLIVASHELYALSTLPTVNITDESPFNFTVIAAADFTGILVDGQALQPANVTDLSIDVSSYKDWLQYDAESRTLFGTPPAGLAVTDSTHSGPVLPVKLTTSFNQTLETTMSLAVVSSYFSASNLGIVNASLGQQVHFDLIQFFSNKADTAQNHDDVNLSVSFFPYNASDYLTFDAASARLSGQVPSNSQPVTIVVTFIAYSHVTHSTSHATLSVVAPPVEAQGQGLGTTSPAARRRKTIILSTVFSIIGGLLCIGIGVALFRRRTRVRESDPLAEEGVLGISDQEKRYHEFAADGSDALCEDIGDDNWSEEANASASGERMSPLETKRNSALNGWERLGLVLPGTVTRTSSAAHTDSSNAMKKSVILGRIRETARNVSDKYKRKVTPTMRPVIGHPRPLTPRLSVHELPLEGRYVDIRVTPASQRSLDEPFPDTGIKVMRPSTMATLVSSPSSSTDEGSIPRRRADFCPRRPPSATVTGTSRRKESIQSPSITSDESRLENIQIIQAPEEKRHLKQKRRLITPTAKVYQGRDTHCASTDELCICIQHPRTFGEGSPNAPSVSDDSKSFPSLASWPGHCTAAVARENRVSQFIVRTGERFTFYIPVTSIDGVRPNLEARLMSGKALPHFLRVELTGHDGDARRLIEFSGTPTERDIGKMYVGVFDVEGGACIVRVTFEFV